MPICWGGAGDSLEKPEMSMYHWQGLGVAAWLPFNSSGCLFYRYCVFFPITYPTNRKESKDRIGWVTPNGSAPIMQ